MLDRFAFVAHLFYFVSKWKRKIVRFARLKFKNGSVIRIIFVLSVHHGRVIRKNARSYFPMNLFQAGFWRFMLTQTKNTTAIFAILTM